MTRKTTSIVICSFNRCEDLRYTCAQLRKLDPQPDEIIICLDGCTDDSAAMLANEFSECIVIENDQTLGSIPSRDRAFRLAKGDLIISLDDDSYPLDPAFLQKAAAVVEQHPEAGAFTFPEIRNDGKAAVPNLSPESPGQYIRDFPNCAGVMLRDVYGKVAAYPNFFSHAYGEPDYCLQLYAAGYAVWFEPSLPIRHHFTPKQRNMLTRHLQNARNELWSVLMRCPFPQLLLVVPFRVLRQLAFALGQGRAWYSAEPQWWLSAAKGIPICLRNRRPLSWRTYYNWMRLARRPILQLDDLRNRFGRQFDGQSCA